MNKCYNITLLFIFLSGLLNAQEDFKLINLETALEIGGANNLTIKEYKERQELAIANLYKAKGWWLPNIYSGVNTHQRWGNAMNGDGNFFNDVNRQNFWLGLGLNATWNFGNGIFKENTAELKVQAATYQTQVEQNKALLEIIKTYYDFLAQQLYFKAYQQLASQAETIAEQIGIQVESGLQFESEFLLAQSNYMHLKIEMLNAKTEYNNKSASLIKLLNITSSTKLIGSDTILAPLHLVELDEIKMSIDSTYKLRPELIGMELILQSLNSEKKTTTTGLLLPELRLRTYGSYFGGVFSQLDPTSEINAALIWKIPLGRLAYKGTLKQYNSQIALHKIKIEQAKTKINAEVLSAREQIIIAKQQIEISLEGNNLAKKALEQSIKRQEMGVVRPFEILPAQEIYIKSKLDYLKAISSYNKAQYSYYVAIGNNL